MQLSDLQEQEQLYMSEFLRRVQRVDTTELHAETLEQWTGYGEISPKVENLVSILLSEWTPTFTGLVFVEQRATVAMLAQLLSTHPALSGKYNIATFVGTSSNANRKDNIINLVQPRNQQDTLDDFRVGKKNLVIATSVLEEGIDVSTCHCVICFDAPKNLKSFIQRRGRARRQDSTYFIMLPDSSSIVTKGPAEWEALEEEMKRAYLDDMRAVKLAEERESIEEPGQRSFEVESTGLVPAKHSPESNTDIVLFCRALLTTVSYRNEHTDSLESDVHASRMASRMSFVTSSANKHLTLATRTGKSDSLARKTLLLTYIISVQPFMLEHTLTFARNSLSMKTSLEYPPPSNYPLL